MIWLASSLYCSLDGPLNNVVCYSHFPVSNNSFGLFWFGMVLVGHGVINWGISSSWIVSMNKNSWRISVLTWFLIIDYRSQNKKNDHLTRPREGPRLDAWVSRNHYTRSSNKQLLLWKISGADNQGLLCWLT